VSGTQNQLSSSTRNSAEPETRNPIPDTRNPKPETPSPHYAQITITDTGIGITPEFLPHVFDRFLQAEKSGSAGGLGLGLAIAHHLVELHHGTIHADSPGVGLGATFTVCLPLIEEK
jgi:hypothetical protein